MRLFAVLWLIIVIFASTARAYPEDQLEACILGSKQNPVILGTPQKSIEEFCHCSLKSIFDENKEVKSAINECGLKNLS